MDNKTSGVSLPASIQEEQEILKDFLADNIDGDDDFGDSGVCANCNRESKEYLYRTQAVRPLSHHQIFSTDFQRKDWGLLC